LGDTLKPPAEGIHPSALPRHKPPLDCPILGEEEEIGGSPYGKF
jgi:hypothetical protein